jgi:cytidylate kinase
LASEAIKRDINDSTREMAPLRQADDAVVIDTTDKDIDGVTNIIISQIRELHNIEQ